MKAKLRLLLTGISVILIPSIIYLIKSSFVRHCNGLVKQNSNANFIFQNSSLVRTISRDDFIHNVHLRKLNQPFEWHSQGPGGGNGGVEDLRPLQMNETITKKKKLSTCRNSIQGKLWIADDQGIKYIIQWFFERHKSFEPKKWIESNIKCAARVVLSSIFDKTGRLFYFIRKFVENTQFVLQNKQIFLPF